MGNFTLLLTCSGQEWQFHIATDILWSRMAISHCYWHIVVKNGNFTLLLTSCGQEWQFHIATGILVVRNGHFTLLLTPCGQNGNFTLLLTSCVVVSQEWQFHIATDTPVVKWSRMARISHCYWHVVVKNGNFTLLLTSSGQDWQLADLPADIPLQMHHGIYIKGCIWQPFCILQEKGGNFLLFLNN